MRTLLCIMLLLTVNASAEVYRYQDASGRMVYSDHPPDGAIAAEQIAIRHNAVASGPPAAEQSEREVTMYSAAWCGICKQARRYFEDQGIDFAEYDIERDEQGRREFARLGGRGVPLILVDDRRMDGFEAARFDALYHADTP